MPAFTVQQAQANFSRLIDEAIKGNDVRTVPIEPRRKRRAGSTSGRVGEAV